MVIVIQNSPQMCHVSNILPFPVFLRFYGLFEKENIITNRLTQNQPTFLNNSQSPTTIDVRQNTTTKHIKLTIIIAAPTLLNNSLPHIGPPSESKTEDKTKSSQVSSRSRAHCTEGNNRTSLTRHRRNWTELKPDGWGRERRRRRCHRRRGRALPIRGKQN